MNFILALLLAVVVIALAVILLSVQLFLCKDGRFSSMHIADSKPMRERGITCANSQDRLERRRSCRKMDLSNM